MMHTLSEAAKAAVRQDALVNAIWTRLTDYERKDAHTPWDVSEAADWWWTITAGEASQKVPSKSVRAAVVMVLCRRINAERRFSTDKCPDCKGEGTRNQRMGGHGDPEWDAEVECSDCEGTGVAVCECCGEEVGRVVTPLGLYGRKCAVDCYPGLAEALG